MAFSKRYKFAYYTQHILPILTPNVVFRKKASDLLREADDREDVRKRASYYFQQKEPFKPSATADYFRLRPWKKRSTYQLDLMESLRYFPRDYKLDLLFGDNIQEPEHPTIVKSRPVSENPSNAILLKLNRIRHFRFVHDSIGFEEKENKLVWRGNAAQPQRVDFLKKYYEHPLCDVGHFHHHFDPNIPYSLQELSMKEQLKCKFILALEGNDVATNLKWIMSSNSLCFMPKCKYETWFMEGKLVPGEHYVELASDYRDVEEKLTYYTNHPKEAEAIIENANKWVRQFMDTFTEKLIAIRVLDQYFKLSES